jgi:multiple antibiotic resistance protein
MTAAAGTGHLPVGFSEILTFLFVMVGPLRILGPFAKLTGHFTEDQRRQLALQTAGLATVALIAGAFLGSRILSKWHVTPGALVIAGAVILFLVAISLIMQSSGVAAESRRADDSLGEPDVARACFSAIATPYGIALLVALFSLQPQSIPMIVGALLTVIALDLLTMLYASKIVHWLGAPLQVLGSVLGILQVALSIQLMYVGFRLLVGIAR